MGIGSIIEKARRVRNINQSELAEKASITQSYLSLIESDKKQATQKTLESIATALNIPLPILFFMSMTEEDIPKHKRRTFELFMPAIRELIEDNIINNP